jgi:hypothetical protein
VRDQLPHVERARGHRADGALPGGRGASGRAEHRDVLADQARGVERLRAPDPDQPDLPAGPHPLGRQRGRATAAAGLDRHVDAGAGGQVRHAPFDVLALGDDGVVAARWRIGAAPLACHPDHDAGGAAQIRQHRRQRANAARTDDAYRVARLEGDLLEPVQGHAHRLDQDRLGQPPAVRTLDGAEQPAQGASASLPHLPPKEVTGLSAIPVS